MKLDLYLTRFEFLMELDLIWGMNMKLDLYLTRFEFLMELDLIWI